MKNQKKKKKKKNSFKKPSIHMETTPNDDLLMFWKRTGQFWLIYLPIPI